MIIICILAFENFLLNYFFKSYFLFPLYISTLASCSFVYFFSFFVLFLWLFFIINIDLFIKFYLTLLSYFFFFSPYLVVLFSLLSSSVGTIFWSCFLFCVVISFVFNWLVSFLVSYARWATLLYLIYFGLFRVCVGVYSFLCVSICLIFAFTVRLGFIFCLLSFLFISYFISYVAFYVLFLLLPFIDITNSLWGLGSPTRSQAWASGVGMLSPRH